MPPPRASRFGDDLGAEALDLLDDLAGREADAEGVDPYMAVGADDVEDLVDRADEALVGEPPMPVPCSRVASASSGSRAT